ncbi:ZIP family metal transporter [Legionella sp. W05-934-2]|uniref:ZIP family metal transporter n=1 Tax=Legionella sp. W05-934-2 TaxID=1198649 RepID=UPI0034626AF7
MVSSYMLKLLFALAILAVTWLAGWYPFRHKKKHSTHFELPVGESLATGVFLGAALMHMLPEAHQLFQNLGYHFPFSYSLVGIVFLGFLWLEHLGKELYEHRDTSDVAFAILAMVMMSVHSIISGTALGITQHNSVIIILFLAIIAHKWAESFAISIQLNKSNMSLRNGQLLFMIFSFMTPLGILIGGLSGQQDHNDSLFDAVIMSISAGTFLYLGTLHGLERCVMVQRCCNLRDFSFVIIGFLMMGLAAIYV